MADKTILIELDVQEKGAISSINKLNNSLKNLDKTSDDYADILEKIQAEEAKLASIQARRVKSQGVVAKSMKKTSDATGSATAATMELSRVISDAPYGIRGMANNITQLVSQLGTASTKAGGLGAALKLMGSQLMGPLGIVFAITAAVSALDYFFGAQEKTEEATKKTTDALTAQRKELEGLTEEYSEHQKLTQKAIMLNSKETEMLKALRKEVTDSTNSDERRNESLNKLIKLYPKYFKGLKIGDLNKLLKAEEEVGKVLTNKIKLKENLSRAEKIANEIQLEKLRLDELEKKTGQKPVNTPKLMSLYEEQEAVRDLLGIYAALDLSVSEPKDKEVTAGKIIDPKSFEADLFEIEKMLNNFRLEDVKNSAKTEQEKAAAKSLIELDKFTSNYKKYTENENKKFAKFKEDLNKQLEAKKISEAAYNNALGIATEKKRKGDTVSYENYLKGLRAISKQYSPDIIGEGITVTTTLAEQAKKDAKIKLDGQLDAFLEYAKSAKIALTAISSFLQAESDRELTIEQNKTNALNQELNNRLLNENLSKDQRASIQNQIAINDEKLRKKQNKIKEKAFKTQKAFNIALAVTDTITAGIGAARATYGGPIAKIAAMTATIGAGMLQVAMIARQKFQPDAANTPVNIGSSGAGGGSARAEPSFNIVGRSNDNILMSAIQSQFDQPLRAYVVARDVTNQQQLDGVISGAAST
jgi:hypothetical protein